MADANLQIGGHMDRKIILIITGNCNLNCTYCYEKSKSSTFMNEQTAKDIIDKNLESVDSRNDTVTIEYFGGEPFIHFKLIKSIDEYLQSKYHDYNIKFLITSNGTMVHGNLQQWLYERKERYNLILSLDGYKAAHDSTRIYKDGRGSFYQIDINFFKNTWSDLSVNMTVAPESLDKLYDSVVWIEKNGFICQSGFALGVKWSSINYLKILEEQLLKLETYYTENPENTLCLLLRYDLHKLLKPFNDKYIPCGVGTSAQCYDFAGDKYPCNGLSFLSFGRDSKRFMGLGEEAFYLTDTNICRSCRLLRLCKTCYAANYYLYGDMHKQSVDICSMNKLCIETSLKIQKIRNKQNHYYTEEDFLYIEKIVNNAAEI